MARIRWIRVIAKIERAADGRALRLIGAHIDITDRMHAETKLRESEERFRLIANSAPVPIWVTKLDRTRSFANQAYLDFLGLPFEEAIVFDWRKALHPDDLPRVLQEQITGEASLKPFVLEARYRRADGEWRWLRSESQPRWDPNGEHSGFIGVAHDITAAKEAEISLRRLNETLERRIEERTAQLRSSEAQMRAILETSHQYQGLLNLDGELLYANKTALAGIRSEGYRLIGRPFWDTPWFAATEGMPQQIREAFAKVLHGKEVRLDMLLHLPVGDREFDFVMRPLFDQDSAVSGAVLEAVDITERRQSEEVLRQSQKMEAVGQLTGGVAHDFNNLLTIIRSATDFLRRRDLAEERRRRYVDAISETVERASKLTAQLLAFARRQPLKPEVFDVGTQVENVAQLVGPLVGGSIQIEVDIRDKDCFTLADIAQFETALLNLAINGRDAMNGEGRLAISVRKVTAIPVLRAQPARSGDFIAISVEDTGTGIAAKNISAIFEPFFTTKEVGKGTGLGLSQAFGFAKQSGGDIDVKSMVGHGATFTIYLPQAAAPVKDKPGAATGGETVASGRGYRVLIVEDNDDVGMFSTELLEDLGYSVKRVANANAALAILAEDEFGRSRLLRRDHAWHERRRARRHHPRALSRSAGGADQRLQQRARRECPSWLRVDSEALFGRAAVAHPAQGDGGEIIHRSMSRDVSGTGPVRGRSRGEHMHSRNRGGHAREPTPRRNHTRRPRARRGQFLLGGCARRARSLSCGVSSYRAEMGRGPYRHRDVGRHDRGHPRANAGGRAG